MATLDPSPTPASVRPTQGAPRPPIVHARTKGQSAQGDPLKPLHKSKALLTDPLLNKGTAFTEAERDALGLRGLLPPRVFPLDEQLHRTLAALRRKTDAIEKYIYLVNLQNRNEVLFYRLVMEHLEEIVPIIYTPTVGEACIHYGSIFRRARGLFISRHDRGRIAEVMRNWPRAGARLIVVTDGEAFRMRDARARGGDRPTKP